MTIVYFFIMIIEGNTLAFQDSNLFYLSKYELVCDMFVHVYMSVFFRKISSVQSVLVLHTIVCFFI